MSDMADLSKSIDTVRNNPLDCTGYLERGIIWFNLKCFDECISDMMLYEALGGTDDTFKKYLGMALSKTSSKRSQEYLKQYVNSHKDDQESLVFLAESYFECGDYSTSASFYSRAVENGYDPSIMRAKASLLANQKMYDEASFFDSSFGKKKLFRR